MNSAILLAAAGLVAGAMNAMAGGGSFVTLPALMAVGVPSVAANASSTMALLPGSLASVWAYRRGLGPVAGIALGRLFASSITGGVIGAALLLSTPSSAFDAALPWLLLIATLTLIGGRPLGDWARGRFRITPRAVLSVQFCLGVYGGYFGGAVGIMMLAVWGLVDPRDVQGLNPSRTALVSSLNGVAVVLFVLAHAVRWRETTALLIGATVGGYVGALVGRSARPRVARAVTLSLSVCVTAAFFVRSYRQ